jgi:TorA maturation chaperone TorD
MDLPPDDLAAIHALLSRIFLREADVALLQELARPAIADVLDALEPGFSDFVRQTDWSERALEDLAAEYAGLFLLPGGVTPYAAGWQEGEEGTIRATLQGEISALYDALHVRPADFGSGNIPADHIGMLLALRTVALQTGGPGARAARVMALYETWAPHFATGILEKAGTPLYRGAARLLHELL